MEQRTEKAKQMVSLEQQLKGSYLQMEFVKRKLGELSSGTSKTERDAVIVIDRDNKAAGKIRLNYLVNQVVWRRSTNCARQGHKLSVPSRNDEQVVEVAKLSLAPKYYYKAVPVLNARVYRLADLVNKSELVLLPGEATMYQGSDFVGRMTMPLVAIGEEFTAGFGVDPQLADCAYDDG